ncbi:MAG TPA: phosphatase PAP2 family protein, partial [Labilithrix sp.]
MATGKRVSAAIGGAIFALAQAARADGPHELRHDVATDAVVTITSAIVIVGAELGKNDIAPRSCQWCDPPGIDSGARDALRWNETRTAAHLSDGIGLLAAPIADFGLLWVAGRDGGATGGQQGVDALLVAEAVMISGVANELTKNVVGRERPFVHALRESEKQTTPHPSDNQLSFYSGHTASTTTLAAAAGTIATLRGYRLAPAIFATGGAVAAFTGYLRIAA